MAGKRKLASDINVVPYIDVMLVLLVIFMITAPLLMQGVSVDLPQTTSKPLPKQVDPVIVSVKTDGTYYLNVAEDNKAAMAMDVLKKRVAKIVKQKPATPVLIWADTKVDYGVVVDLIAQLQQSGVPDVGLVTEEPQ